MVWQSWMQFDLHIWYLPGWFDRGKCSAIITKTGCWIGKILWYVIWIGWNSTFTRYFVRVNGVKLIAVYCTFVPFYDSIWHKENDISSKLWINIRGSLKCSNERCLCNEWMFAPVKVIQQCTFHEALQSTNPVAGCMAAVTVCRLKSKPKTVFGNTFSPIFVEQKDDWIWKKKMLSV